MDILTLLSDHLQHGNVHAVRDLTRQALHYGASPTEVLERSLLAGMGVVGARFREHEIFLPDVLLAARAMHAAMGVLKPRLADRDMPWAATVVLGTVAGDVHDIGKNLVGIMLQGAGYDVVDLGTGVPAHEFVDAAVETGARVIGISALLTTTMPGMEEVVSVLRERGLAGRIATIVGGAPVTERFARQIGADAYACDASVAVERVRALVLSAA